MARLGNGMEFGQGMARRDRKGRWRFWGLALLWLPAGVVGQAIVRFGTDTGPPAEPGMWLATVPMMAVSLVPVAPCGLPLALGCRRLWWLGYSGQLAAYVNALRAAGMECAGCWLHLPVGGGLVEVVLPRASGHALTHPAAA